MFRLRAGPKRLSFATRAAAAMGICVLAGWLANDQPAGLIATLGAFAALYGSGRPYRNRAILIALISVGLVFCVACGVVAAAASPWLSVSLAAFVAFGASFLCSALNVGPPGAYLFTLACAAATNMRGEIAYLGRIAFLVAAGGAAAWVLQMAGVLWRPRGPEERALANAANAIADFIGAAARGHADLQRHATAVVLHEAWLTLVARQPAHAKPDGTLHRLRALSRKLHRLFGQAITTAGAGAGDAIAAAADARAVAAKASNPPPVGDDDALHRPLAYIGAREALAMSMRPGATPLRIALRVGAAALISGAIGASMGLDRAYWAIAASVLMLYQGLDWTRALQRGLERTLGTFTGLALAAGLLTIRPHGLALVGLVMGLQFLIELVVVRNYALATVFITPIALIVAEAANPTIDVATLLIDRGLDTFIGCAVGLAVLFVTSRRHGERLQDALDRSIAAARALLPRLADGDVTSAPARIERQTLRNSAVDLILHYEDQAGASGRGREEADRLWPAIVAAQRLAFRILAACWHVEAGGSKPVDSDTAAALDRQLKAIRQNRPSPQRQPSEFLSQELAALEEALDCDQTDREMLRESDAS